MCEMARVGWNFEIWLVITAAAAVTCHGNSDGFRTWPRPAVSLAENALTDANYFYTVWKWTQQRWITSSHSKLTRDRGVIEWPLRSQNALENVTYINLLQCSVLYTTIPCCPVLWYYFKMYIMCTLERIKFLNRHDDFDRKTLNSKRYAAKKPPIVNYVYNNGRAHIHYRLDDPKKPSSVTTDNNYFKFLIHNEENTNFLNSQ